VTLSQNGIRRVEASAGEREMFLIRRLLFALQANDRIDRTCRVIGLINDAVRLFTQQQLEHYCGMNWVASVI
jgi:hypothetical protein